MSAVGSDNDHANSNDIVFTIKDTKLYVPAVILSNILSTMKNYQNFLAKGLKGQCIRMNVKQKVRTKIQQTSLDIFLNQTLEELTDCLFWFI